MKEKIKPYVVCHMLASLDGKIDGAYMSAPECMPALKAYASIRGEYQCKAAMYGTVTMEGSYADGLVGHLHGDNASFSREDFVAVASAKNYIVSVDPKGTLAFDSNYIPEKILLHGKMMIMENQSGKEMIFMEKKNWCGGVAALILCSLVLTSCSSTGGNGSVQQEKMAGIQESASEDNGADFSSEIPAGDGKTLIAYFTLEDNYENENGLDATTQASLNPDKEDLIGNTEYIARFIQQEVGGEIFSVKMEKPYPNDYDKITDMGSEEQEKNARPALKTHVENMDQYQTVYLGFPIWWYTMPQAMFTFLEEYDFSGKTIIPFTTHGGYGVGSSVEDIKKLCPDASVNEKIFELERDDNIPGKQEEVEKWLKEIGMK